MISLNRYRVVGLASLVLLVVVITISASYYWEISTAANNQSSGSLSKSQLAAINVTSSNVSVSGSNSTIYINGSAELPVMMGPMNAPSMYNYEILGKINPTLVIAPGSQVNFTVVNVDTDSYHNFIISFEGPPYYYMGGMMDGNNGNYSGFGNMMRGYFQNNNSHGYMMGYLPPQSSGHFAYTNVSYDFSSSGTFWYLCSYPGHAANGMYGEIIVS